MIPVARACMESTENDSSIAESARKAAEIDLSLLEDSLRLTPWQRLLENERALALVRMLEAARMRGDGASESDP